MFEVYYRPPEDPSKESTLKECVSGFGGRLDYREVPDEGEPGGVCLTFEFDDLSRARAAAESLRQHGEHVEGPVDYGPSSVVTGGKSKTASLEDRLHANGCGMPLAGFQEMLAETLGEMYRSWSVDELLLHPREELDYCSAIRRRSGFHDLPDDLILRCLLARRKNP